jgi:GNAT superfamily N-acetyltransferase
VSGVIVRAAAEADLDAIAAVTIATNQHGDWTGANPAYVGHLMEHGRVVVAELDGKVAGFGATRPVGAGPGAISMLCDLFVDPAAHGRGCGRAMLAQLWRGAQRRMTFSSLHANAVPLYTSFGLDAWWPLLYLHGELSALPVSGGSSVESASAGQVARAERDWTGLDRAADHRAWSARPGGAPVLVKDRNEVLAAGTVIKSGTDCGIVHLALAPAADDGAAVSAVTTVLRSLDPAAGQAQVCLPAPHPAVRALLGAGWRFDEFDLFMASERDLLDPRRAVPSPELA